MANVLFCGEYTGPRPQVIKDLQSYSSQSSCHNMAVLLCQSWCGVELLSWPQKALEGFGHHWQADLKNERCFLSLCQMGQSLFLPHCGDILILGQSSSAPV